MDILFIMTNPLGLYATLVAVFQVFYLAYLGFKFLKFPAQRKGGSQLV